MYIGNQVKLVRKNFLKKSTSGEVIWCWKFFETLNFTET